MNNMTAVYTPANYNHPDSYYTEQREEDNYAKNKVSHYHISNQNRKGFLV